MSGSLTALVAHTSQLPENSRASGRNGINDTNHANFSCRNDKKDEVSTDHAPSCMPFEFGPMIKWISANEYYWPEYDYMITIFMATVSIL